jgi:glycosyltransferase involved in cell wall biosynthesis
MKKRDRLQVKLARSLQPESRMSFDPQHENTMKRVGILHYAAPPIVGGVESTIYHHARLLAQAGLEVDVIAGRGEPFHPQVNFHTIPEMDSNHPTALAAGKVLAQGQVPQSFHNLQDEITRKLAPILAQSQACIVHNAITLHKNLPLTAALYQLAQARVTSFLAWCHDFAWQDRLYTPDLHPGYPWDLLRKPWPGTRYIVVSEHRRERLAELLELPKSEIKVITPGVDVLKFLKLESLTVQLVERLNLLEADPLILLPARITRRKNIQFAIRATEMVKKFKPRAALLVTGPPGPHNPQNLAYLESLQTLRTELGLQDTVFFLYELGEIGTPLHLPDQVIADLYRLADVLLFPSTSEGFGIPVLEAGLARLPIIAADIPPFRESAGDLAELFDPHGDPEKAGCALSLPGLKMITHTYYGGEF